MWHNQSRWVDCYITYYIEGSTLHYDSRFVLNEYDSHGYYIVDGNTQRDIIFLVSRRIVFLSFHAKSCCWGRTEQLMWSVLSVALVRDVQVMCFLFSELDFHGSFFLAIFGTVGAFYWHKEGEFLIFHFPLLSTHFGAHSLVRVFIAPCAGFLSFLIADSLFVMISARSLSPLPPLELLEVRDYHIYTHRTLKPKAFKEAFSLEIKTGYTILRMTSIGSRILAAGWTVKCIRAALLLWFGAKMWLTRTWPSSVVVKNRFDESFGDSYGELFRLGCYSQCDS